MAFLDINNVRIAGISACVPSNICLLYTSLSQMEERVKADIWYMEHWTMLLDIYRCV